MKQTVISILMMLAVASTAMAKPADTLTTDTTQVDEVEVFSDTTSTDSASSAGFPIIDEDDWDDWEQTDASSIIDGLDISHLTNMFFVLCVLSILFILLPIVIIGLVLYFVHKNRKDKLRLAEMAMRNGKPIPVDVMGNLTPTADALWNKGIKQMFLGAGVAILLWVILDKLGLAIGALILLLGCGNMVIASQERKKQKERDLYNRMFNEGENETSQTL